MSAWQMGRAQIEQMLRDGTLERVHPSREAADELIGQASRHAASAAAISSADPDGAHSLMYDAARKTLAAILQNQGLRATSSGGHVAVIEAVRAQLGPASDVLTRQTNRLRIARNRSEYKPLEGPRLEPADVDDQLPAVVVSIEQAGKVLDSMPPF